MSRVKFIVPLLALLAFGFSACSNSCHSHTEVVNGRTYYYHALLVPPYPTTPVWYTLADRRDLYSPTFVNGPYTRSLMDGTWADNGVKPVDEEYHSAR